MSPLTHRAAGRPVTLVDLLRQRADEHPEALAFRFLLNGETAAAALTWREVETRARAIGAFLQQREARGSRVFIVDDSGPPFITGFFGCVYAGLIPVPVAPPKRRHADRLAAIAERCHPAVVLSVSDSAARLSRAMSTAGPLGSAEWLDIRDVPDDLSSQWHDPNLSGDDIAFLQFTSGSTARPRGAMVSHANILHNQQLMQHAFSTGPRSIVAGWLPLHHDMGLIGTVLHPLYLGVSAVLMSPGHFMERPMRWLRAVSRYRATISGGPNFSFALCARRASAEELEPLDLSCWAVAFNGSETVRPDTMRRFADTFAAAGFKPQAFHPCYGLAEATLFVAGRPDGSGPASRSFIRPSLETSAARRADEARASPEGSPTDAVSSVDLTAYAVPTLEQRLLIVRPEQTSICGPREIGELWVSGPSVAQGYWNDPDETRSAFEGRIEGESGTFLRTGDLGFVDEGTLFITGRLKDLLTIRGRNIHPEDVERTVAASHAALRDAASVAFAVDDDRDDRLVVVQEWPRGHRYVSREEIAAAARQAVADEYEVQLHTFVLVTTGRIPRTTSGKLQRRLCRALFLAGSLEALGVDLLRPTNSSIAEPSPSARAARFSGNQIESILKEEAARLLGVRAAAIDLNLPPGALGIDSLMSVELQYCLERRSGVTLSDGTVRRAATLAALCEELTAHLATDRRPAAAVVDGRTAAFPLSSGQRALWFLEQLEGAGTSAVLTRAVHIDGPLNVPAFERALHALVDRHEALRTTIATSPGEPMQVVHPCGELELEVQDASGWTGDSLQRRVQGFADRPMPLSNAPLVRAVLFRRSDVQHVFAMTLHHSMADYWSLAVMLRDLEELYAAEGEGRSSRLQPIDAAYRDYVAMEQTLLQSAEAERLHGFWEQRLEGAPLTLDLHPDRPRPPVQSPRGASIAVAIGAPLAASVRTFAASQKTTMFTVLLAAYQTLLHRYSGQADLLVGTPVASRPGRWRDTVGYCVNLVPLRAVLSDDTTFEGLVGQADTWVREALDNQTLPFAALVERLRPPRDPSRHPLVQCTFALLTDRHFGRPGVAACAAGVDGPPLQLADLTLRYCPIEHRAAQFDLSLTLADSPHGLVGRFEYNTDLFDAATIRRLSARWVAWLETLVSQPAAQLGDLPLLTASEQRIAKGATFVRRPLAGRVIHELFEAQVDRAVNARLTDETSEIGYQELNVRANQWARVLKRTGLRADTSAALCTGRSINMALGALAILKAGGAYVPLDPSHPSGRLARVLTDCEARVLVADRSALAVLPPFTGRIVCLDDHEPDIRGEETSNLHEPVHPEQAAYVLYTSGSTGSPNGVVVSHESVCNLLESMRRTPGLRASDRLLSVTTLAFDIAGLELFLPLTAGASLMIASRDTVRDGQRLMQRLMAFDATVMQATPSTWRMLLDAGWPGKADLTVLCGGEALTRDLAAKLLPRCAALWNMYGPTETTIWSTTARISGVDDHRISLGVPIDNTEVYVLDRRLHPVPPGMPGEIFIGGIGLARGYLGRPDLTAARFVPHPFSQLPGSRLYRTGDRGRQRSDGSLEFLGRMDDQIKVRGFRVELHEVERTLSEHSAVREAVAALGEDPRGERALVAYVVLEQADSIPAAGMESELREHLAAILPAYMVPAAMVTLRELPLTPNGKVDRRRLPPVAWGSATALTSHPGSTREQIIRDIWRGVLKIDRIGMTDNFFDLGGHSLLLNEVRTRIASAVARDVPMIEFFRRPTIRALAQYLDAHRLAPDVAEAHVLHAADQRRAAGPRQRELKRRRRLGATIRNA